MKKFIFLICLFLASCQLYVTEIKDVTLSGKYVVSKLEVTTVDQGNLKNENYLVGETYINDNLAHPFNKIIINNFYIHFDYSTIRMGEIRTDSGRDIWEYGMSPNYIFYRNFGRTPFHSGYIQFNYLSNDGGYKSYIFIIEDDGLETLQLKSFESWPNTQFGGKEVVTMLLTRVGP